MNKILVWDLPLRLFHWLLVALVVVSVISANIGGNAMQIHLLSGYTVLALLLFRILWGFFGSTHARFASFVRSPVSAFAYLRSLRRGEASQHLGHNPAGAWSVIVMLTVLLVQASTGLFANDDIATEGPLAKLLSKDLSDRITGIHHLNIKLLYALIALHLSAVAFYVLGKHENLVKPMITGFKSVANGGGGGAQRPARIWLAAVLLAICAGAVYLLVKFS
ncbi:MAG: cytochrome b/b6 domain-containing protein [Burkholderiales bacterium]|nr:cytochrome b/b6 domain-containing protein [Burkholderiales bacterium]